MDCLVRFGATLGNTFPDAIAELLCERLHLARKRFDDPHGTILALGVPDPECTSLGEDSHPHSFRGLKSNQCFHGMESRRDPSVTLDEQTPRRPACYYGEVFRLRLPAAELLPRGISSRSAWHRGARSFWPCPLK